MRRELFFPICLCVIFLAFLSSCSKHNYPIETTQPVLYPSPPDTARIQFLTRYGNSADINRKQSKLKTFVAGQENALPIIKPYGIAMHNGKLFIADPGIAGFEVINFKDNSFEYFIPKGRGKLKVPRNCFLDDFGNLYVADPERQQVVIFNENREYIGEIGGADNFKPSDVFVTGDTILVTDPTNNKINVYNKTSHQILFTFPEATVGDENWLYNPQNLNVKEGKIFVTDFGDPSVKMFTMDGNYIGSVGSYGRRLGQFVRPKGTAIDSTQNLYVVDAGFENIQIFNKMGQLLMFFGGSYNGPGDMYMPANVIIDYNNIRYFEKYVDPAYSLKYLIFVTNQYGPDKICVYGRIEPK